MSVFVPLTVLQRFVRWRLGNDAAVTTALGGAGRIHPNYSPSNVTARHLVHEDYGGARVNKPTGSAIPLVEMTWAVTAWEPGPSQQALEPLMEAVMVALIGEDATGETHRFSDAPRVWDVYCDYAGPDKVPIDVAPTGVWAPVRELYTMTLQRAA